MASKAQMKRKTATKRNRSASKGTASRKKVAVRSSGKGIATAAIAKRK